MKPVARNFVRREDDLLKTAPPQNRRQLGLASRPAQANESCHLKRAPSRHVGGKLHVKLGQYEFRPGFYTVQDNTLEAVPHAFKNRLVCYLGIRSLLGR